VFVVSDVHGAYGDLARLADLGETVLVLGDLVNLIDYRTNSGLLADVFGRALVGEVVALRTTDPAAATRLWMDAEADRGIDVRAALGERVAASYRDLQRAFAGVGRVDVDVIHGNVDDPELLRQHLPDGLRWAQGTTRVIDGELFGFAGGGVPRIGTPGEVGDSEMAETLAALGPVDVLCTHVPPALPMLSDDVIGGPGKGSVPVLDYIERHQPSRHYFGDVHQPRAVRMRHGVTECVNVGYFRATGRPVRHTAARPT
jgi:Icc-related predicted phosphoesterase